MNGAETTSELWFEDPNSLFQACDLRIARRRAFVRGVFRDCVGVGKKRRCRRVRGRILHARCARLVALKPNTAIELKLPSGGHTLRVTAPGMRAYQSELVVEDNEARAVAVTLEREAEAEKAKLRVAVGCIDAAPRGTEDGLSVYLDSSPTGAIPTGDHKTRSEAGGGKDVVEYVEFPVANRHHLVSVRILDCEAIGWVTAASTSIRTKRTAKPSPWAFVSAWRFSPTPNVAMNARPTLTT